MMQHAEIIYDEIDAKESFDDIINKVINECFENEGLDSLKLYASITLTNSKKIKELNKQFRNIDKETDVLSFPMFEPNEIEEMKIQGYDGEEALGDIVISINKVEEQAKEYGHSFERELSYMCVHSFYHLMGYDHMTEADKSVMRAKEDEILNKLQITREG